MVKRGCKVVLRKGIATECKRENNLDNCATLLASSDLINPSVIQDKLLLACLGASSDWTCRSSQVEYKGYDVKQHKTVMEIKSILTV